jgi:hypothetical protein
VKFANLPALIAHHFKKIDMDLNTLDNFLTINALCLINKKKFESSVIFVSMILKKL